MQAQAIGLTQKDQNTTLYAGSALGSRSVVAVLDIFVPTVEFALALDYSGCVTCVM